MAAAKKKYRYVGRHPEPTADSVMRGPGEFLTLTEEQEKDPHNARLIDNKLLIPVNPSDSNKEKGD